MTGRIVLDGVTVRFGALEAVSEVSGEFPAGAIIGLIGPNGAGKTTLLNAISGFTEVTAGRVLLDGADLARQPIRARVGRGVVRSFQTVRLLERETVFENVLVGCERFAQPGFFPQFLDLGRQRRARRRDIAATEEILTVLRLAADAHRPVAELPFASRRLTEIARILVVRPRILLLDEPAAGLDTAERLELTRILRDYHREEPFTMVLVEHDVDLVSRFCEHVVALDSGKVIAVGAPAEVLASAAVRTAYFGTAAHA